MNNFSHDQDELKTLIQKYLCKEISNFVLKATGAVNHAYYIETQDGSKYIVKQEREVKEFQPQNSLVIEARVAQTLSDLNLSTPTPRVAFISENPPMYAYEYIEGELMKDVWPSLSEEERINICQALGRFHAEIGKKFTKEMAENIGINIDPSTDLHPEVKKEYEELTNDPNIPEEFKTLVKHAKTIFDGTMDQTAFQFLHNDSHHENILIKGKKITGIIDFGNAEYGEIAKEFSRYIRDFPDHFKYIVASYEEVSGNKLSYERLISNALISGFAEIVEDYKKGGEGKVAAEKLIENYQELI